MMILIYIYIWARCWVVDEAIRFRGSVSMLFVLGMGVVTGRMEVDAIVDSSFSCHSTTIR
jgi:hypothetical protein